MAIRTLVIDDEPSIRESLTEFLEDFDFDVTAAESAEEALDLISDHNFDVAVVDLRLPGMSGEAMIAKAHLMNPDMQFLIHTGSVDYRLSKTLTEIGMKPDHLFLKPLPDLKVLVDRIQELVRR
jgi:DNA-binding NtrC family response regulator